MNIFLARQPILDKKQKVLAYEIFYRSGFLNVYTGTDHDEATSKVIIDTFHNLGLDALTAGKPAFINFSAALLSRKWQPYSLATNWLWRCWSVYGEVKRSWKNAAS